MFSNIMDKMNMPKYLPLLLVGDAILMPGSSKRIKIDTPRNLKLVKEHLLRSTSLRSTIIGVVPETIDPSSYGNVPTSIHSIGTAAVVVQVTGTNWPNPEYTLLAHGLCRFSVDKVIQHTPYLTAQVTKLGKWPTEPDDDYLHKDEAISELTALLRKESFQLIDSLDLSDPVLTRLRSIISGIPDHALPDLIVAVLRSSPKEKLNILDAVDLKDRLQRTMPLIVRQLEHMKLLKEKSLNRNYNEKVKKGRGDDIQDVVVIRGNSSEDKQKKFRITRLKDNDSDDDDGDELHALEQKIKSANMPKDVYKILTKELKRLRKMPIQLPDHSLIRNYIEFVSELPWSISTNDHIDIEQAKLDLDKDHYSMEKLKKRVLEYLAVRQLNHIEAKEEMRGPILCFVGPPGVGKTSLGKSIAKTLGRKFHRISLGGVCDQSDIRGHRRTYVGSMPGRIISGIKSVAVNNPVILLDEIDKLGKGMHGDPGAALLEVLDPEQNHLFVDHYLNIPFDLSSVLFIATANTISTIPLALLDRMEVIEVPGYTQEEKVKIAQHHLLPKQLKIHGLDKATKVTVSEDAMASVVANYTREAGVRNLERKLAGLCRSIALDVAKQDIKEREPNHVEKGDVVKYLGPLKFENKEAQSLTKPGVATGLAWTATGGVILYVEANRLPEGNGDIILTGQLGDVMKESAQIAVSWLRNNAAELGINDKKILEGSDLHIHFPEGAVGKDGPSAGVTMVTALVSLFTGKLVRSYLAMTGEITLQGLVLPVGGIKEKVLAALRSGMKIVVLPKRNKRNVEAELSKEVQAAIEIRYVSTLEDVLAQAFIAEDISSQELPRCKL